MIAFFGYGGVLLALASAVLLVSRGVRTARSPGEPRHRLVAPVRGMLVGAILAMGALELALLIDDFSIQYVAEHHARSTPLLFTIATAWAALEGSIVLWGLVLAGFTAALLRRVEDGDGLGAGALAVMGLVAIFFFGLMATVANPFGVLEVVPADGPGQYGEGEDGQQQVVEEEHS
ncbi:MAG: hypothetical protein M3N51_02555, partial [Actinomycetota bacterium]|nr:hypothetical protein [Actinomycetota bacterium]